MKISIFRKQRDGSESVANEEFGAYIERISHDVYGDYIGKYREAFLRLENEGRWIWIDRIPTVCPVSEYYRKANGQHAFRTYNGISILEIKGLNNRMEVEKVKKQASLFPQTLCALEGADGHSAQIWTIATLPDGSLPRDEKQVSLFCAQAYATSVRCYQPALEFVISLEAPSMDKRVMLTVDKTPYVNPHPTPFIIEQPTEDSLQAVIKMGDPQKSLERLKPSAESYITFTDMYNAAYKRAMQSLPDWKPGNDPLEIVTRVADVCADCGLPEEEVTARLLWKFYKLRKSEVRSTVNSVYLEYQGNGNHTPMSKHQIVAFRLREFLNRRYDIRYNEVLAMTEFRPKVSLQFMYKELGRRELNSIHHEACLEGIEPTFGEVDNLVHSDYVKMYNPIREYLDELPVWDGKDRIGKVAAMVPNNNKHWERLFYRWFLSMVAHWMNCDTVHANQTAPILIGAQGYRKSTFCRMLLPPDLQQFFTDSIDFRSNTEAERCLSRFLLVNIDEFDQLSEKQFAFVKHLFQKPVTNIRRMYSETIGTQRRYASFIGTSNHDQILRDPTGNRRYICVEVTAPIHVEEAIDYKQLYAQAKHLILHGERYYLNDEDEAIIREMNTTFEQESPLEQLFLTAFAVPADDADGEWMTVTDIMEKLQTMPTYNKRVDNYPNKLGRVLTKLKLSKKRSSSGYKYFVKRIK